MKIIAGISEIPIKNIVLGEFITVDDIKRSGIRVILDNPINDTQLNSLLNNNWCLKNGENITDNFEGFNTLVSNELTFAKIPTAQDEVDAAVKPFLVMLTDEQALIMFDHYPEWKLGNSYKIGDRVRYESNMWRCLTDHISQSGWDPINSPSLWAKVLTSDIGEILEWEQPDSTNPYMIGDKVTHNGKTWISIVGNNTWEPGAYGWEELTEQTDEGAI